MYHQGRRERGYWGGCGTPPPSQDWQISHIRKIGRSISRLFGNKKYVYIPHMNEKWQHSSTLFNVTSAIVW